MFLKRKECTSKRKRGFSMIELVVIIGVMAVLLAILAPSLLQYTEKSRAQRDDSAMDEVVEAVQLAMSDEKCYDEMLRYSCTNNYITYTDSSGVYGQKINDAEFWAPDGSGRATTITFNPIPGPGGKTYYSLDSAIVNDMTYDNGSSGSGDQRTVEGALIENNQCYLRNVSLDGSGAPTGYLYNRIRQIVGDNIFVASATYKNSSYTIFIKFNQKDGVTVADVNGSFNGTNLHKGAPASKGSGTSSYDDLGNPETDLNPGGVNSTPVFSASDLAGGGSMSGVLDYKADKSYTVTYYDADRTTVLKTEILVYGSVPEYKPEKSGKIFNGWDPEPVAVTKDVSYVASWSNLTFANASWDDIASISESGKASEYFRIGDKKTIKCNNYTIEVQIAAFGVDPLADGSGKAGITIITTDVYPVGVSHDPNATSNFKVYPYSTSRLRSYCNDQIYNGLEPSLKSAIKQVSKYSMSSNSSSEKTDDYCWALGRREVGGSSSWLEESPVYSSVFTTTTTYDHASRVRSGVWNLRDVTGAKSNYYVTKNGRISYGSGQNTVRNFMFGFCI